ncbi:PLD nuclease N-terminal domain-containing protein [Streptomyces sp. 71268]|uniref:PLD nuclease N-terminal domain-containing protein n=1 Tax=Streptomyces sp. 71268 TaxID=3002640 RepID=UPI0023F7F864|nr:PLD nuclease N-terminal domain-containing protein [Streptomyces sp. 71268]WEV26113.1 PLD nuclease N-terminal domain-containing protein [Streptomyces sp. 71268]
MLRYLPFLLILALWIYAFIDCLNTPENEVRKLPKVAWVIIVLLFGEVLIGPIAWLTVGRPRKTVGGAGRGGAGGGIAGAFGGRRGGGGWVAPDDNPEFLKSLRKDPPPNDTTGPGSTSSPDAGTDSGPGSASGTESGSGSGPASGTGPGSGADSGPASGTNPGAADREPEADRRDDEGPQGPQRG